MENRQTHKDFSEEIAHRIMSYAGEELVCKIGCVAKKSPENLTRWGEKLEVIKVFKNAPSELLKLFGAFREWRRALSFCGLNISVLKLTLISTFQIF